MSERVGIEEELGKLTICRSVPEVQLAPEIDDETRPRPRRNSYPETAGIIILAEEEGEWGHRNGGVLGSIRRATTRESASHVSHHPSWFSCKI